MKDFFQRKRKMVYFSNIFISLLCTTYVFTGYYSKIVYDDVHHDNVAKIIDNDMEAASQLGMKSNRPVKLTSVVTRQNVNTSNKKYVPAKYNEVTGTAIVNYAKKYLGLRYVSGGNSLSTGTDCSGFTKLIYKEFGITLSRAVKAQVNHGSYVRKSDLRKGDLVFYGRKAGVVSHVGIYIGNGQVIHESTRRDGVKISSVNMMVYVTARRVINETANKIAQEKLDESTKENNTTDAGGDVVTNNDTTNTNINGNTNINTNTNSESNATTNTTDNNTNGNDSSNVTPPTNNENESGQDPVINDSAPSVDNGTVSNGDDSVKDDNTSGNQEDNIYTGGEY